MPRGGRRAADSVTVPTAAALPVGRQDRFTASVPFTCPGPPVLVDGVAALPGVGSLSRTPHVALTEGLVRHPVGRGARPAPRPR